MTTDLTGPHPSLFSGLEGPDDAEFDVHDPSIARDDDRKRLGDQLYKIFLFMNDGGWHTVPEVAASTGYPEPSVSARIRDLRKEKFGAYEVHRRRRGGEESLVFEFQVGPKGAGVPNTRSKETPVHEYALRQAEKLVTYTDHREACRKWTSQGNRCVCGLSEVRSAFLAALREMGRIQA